MLTATAAPAVLPPGPPPIRTPWGLVRYFRGITRDPAAFVGRRFQRYGDLYYAPISGAHLYVTRHPDHFREALLTHGGSFAKTEKGRAAERLERFLGKGLLTSNGELWRRQRRMINPALSRRQIAGYAATMVEHTERMLAGWRAGEARDVAAEMMQLTLRIVTRVLFDHEITGHTDDVARLMTVFREGSAAPALLPSWVPLPSIRRLYSALAAVDRLIDGLIDDRRRQSDEDLAARGDLLSMLVRAVDDEAASDAERTMTRRQLRDEVLTLFLAGHETTSNALAWTWYLLAEHPAVEARLHAELDEVLGDRDPTFEDLDALVYTGQVLDEAMRLYPPAPVVSRTAVEDVQVGGYTVPAGAELLLWIWHAHHDPRWFPEPESFRPERFAPDAPEPPRCAYLPFGAGTRICIGKHFALMEAKLLLATIARRFRLRLVPGQVVTPHFAITLAPRDGLRMRIEAR